MRGMHTEYGVDELVVCKTPSATRHPPPVVMTAHRRFRNFSFYPSIAPTGLVRAEDSLETETRFEEKRRK